ncbi:MAG: pentapeptide repeat-containing protein [Gammaproteobacteria bacterium]
MSLMLTDMTIQEKLNKYLNSCFITTQITTNADFRLLSEQIYVEPESSWTGEGRSSLTKRCDEFIKRPEQKVFVILGGPGVGKTTFGLRYMQNYWQHYQEKIQMAATGTILDEPLPLFIRLNQVLKDGKISTDLLEKFLKEKIDLTITEINELKTKALIVFLDGYDEISDQGNIYQINRWWNWQHLKCIISTRPEKFGILLSQQELQDDLLHAFAPEFTARNARIPDSVVLSKLSKFSPYQLNMYISQWHELTQLQDWSQERYEKNIRNIPGLFKLASTPVISSSVLYALPEIVHKYQIQEDELLQKQLPHIDVYDAFVQVWFSNQVLKLLDKLRQTNPTLVEKLEGGFNYTESLVIYSCQLAYWTVVNQQGGKLNLEIPDVETLQTYLLDNPTSETATFSTKLNDEEKQILLTGLRSCCLLNCQDGYFRFFHKSLTEYFAQCHIFAGVLGLLNAGSAEELKIMDRNISSIYQYLNHQLAEYNLLRMLAERARRDAIFRLHLQKIIQLSKTHPEVATAAANALTIWHYAGEPISNLSLKSVHVSGADLSGAMLHLIDGRYADFSYVNFRGAYLAGANFAGATLTGCQWDNPPDIRFEHPVSALIYSKDGKWLIVGDKGGHIYFIETESYLIEKTCKHYWIRFTRKDAVTCLAVDGDASSQRQTQQASKYLASGSWGGDIYLWEMTNLQRKGPFNYKKGRGSIISLAFLVDGKQLASARQRDHIICIWDVDKGQVIRYLKGHAKPVTSLSYSSQEMLLASGSWDKTVRLWKIDTGESNVLQAHTRSVDSVIFSSEGNMLASVSYDNTARLWNTAREESTSMHSFKYRVICLSYSPQNTLLALGSYDTNIYLWNFKTGAVSILEGRTDSIISLSCSPQGRTLASATRDNAVVRLWEVMPKESSKSQGPASRVLCLAYSRQCIFLASGGYDKIIYLWDLLSREPRALRGHTDSVISLAYSPQEMVLASGSRDKTIRLWNLTNNKVRVLLGHTGWVECLAYSPLGTGLASGGDDNTICLWNLATEEMKMLSGHDSSISCLLYFSQDTLASGSHDKTVRLWNLTSWKSKVLQGHMGSVLCLAYYLHTLASGSIDKSVRLWNVETDEIAVLIGHVDSVTCLAYSPRGAILASGSNDRTIRLWNLKHDICQQVIDLPLPALTLTWAGERLYVGMESFGCNVLSFIYEKNATAYYQCRGIYNPANMPIHLPHPLQQFNIEKARGLTFNRQRFLKSQGAIGQPELIKRETISSEVLQAEFNELTRLTHIKKMLHQLITETSARIKLIPERCRASVFQPMLMINNQQWQVYIVSGQINSHTNKDKQDFVADKPVYGVLEGLSASGQSLFIRFGLEQDKTHKRSGRISIKSYSLAKDTSLEQLRVAVLELLQQKEQNIFAELNVYHAGFLSLTEMDDLLTMLLYEAGHQQADKDIANRIIYQNNNNKLNTKHNGLIWIYSLLKGYKNLQLPRSAIDFFTMSKTSTASRSQLPFFTAIPNEIIKIDIRDWCSENMVKLKIKK